MPPKEISDQIVDRTDGVPLFIEELTKSVVESGIVAEAGGHYAVAAPMAPMAPMAIPTSLHASLLARLDRLAPTREFAQIGAALGRSPGSSKASTRRSCRTPRHCSISSGDRGSTFVPKCLLWFDAVEKVYSG